MNGVPIDFTFLGTGTSVGVPQIGCGCRVCTSPDARDKRRRCGAYVKTPRGAFLIDTPPEMRLACIERGISKVDTVLLTHAHMDHVAGFDDIRRFNTLNGRVVECPPGFPGANGRKWRVEGRPMPCYALPETIAQMHSIFPYIGLQGGKNGLYRPQIDFIDNTEPFETCGVEVRSFRVEHGFPCCGYLIGGKIGYASDCRSIPDEAVEMLHGVDVMIIDCLRKREHPTHMNLELALDCLSRIAPKKAYIVHMCHDLLHEEWERILPSGVRPAFDGLAFSV